MTTYYRNEYLFSEIYLQEITQQPEDTEILASLTTLKEYREFARTATIQEWKDTLMIYKYSGEVVASSFSQIND